MSIKKEIEQEFNKQINEEIYSAYLYLAMAADFAEKNLHGFAQWLKVQAQEEIVHAMKFYNHIIERIGKVELGAIAKPPVSWKTPIDAFKAAHKHEQHITGRINSLVELAQKHKDYASDALLQWFTNEQIEEEAQTDAVAQRLEMAGEHKGALLFLDKEMCKRKFGNT